ncbi:MAG: hypothetical protein K6D02_01925 [Lachnospiraceae bacterium]|nr:hypothetical protein [Lachnospiraceae bacterium]
MKAAIYHFTDSENINTAVCRKSIEALEKLTLDKGYDDYDIYLDTSLLMKNRVNYHNLLSKMEMYDAFIFMDFYHITKVTTSMIKQLKDFSSHNIQIYTLRDGSFILKEAPTDKPLKVATYCCRFGEQVQMDKLVSVENKTLELFVNKKTNWTLCEQYIDKDKNEVYDSQKQLMEIIKNKNKYDLLLIHRLKDISWRSAKFCKRRQQLGMDIYALRDGFLEYERI